MFYGLMEKIKNWYQGLICSRKIVTCFWHLFNCRCSIGYTNDSAYKTEIATILYPLTQKIFLFMFWCFKLLFEHSGYLTMALFWIRLVKDRHGVVLKVFEIILHK